VKCQRTCPRCQIRGDLGAVASFVEARSLNQPKNHEDDPEHQHVGTPPRKNPMTASRNTQRPNGHGFVLDHCVRMNAQARPSSAPDHDTTVKRCLGRYRRRGGKAPAAATTGNIKAHGFAEIGVSANHFWFSLPILRYRMPTILSSPVKARAPPPAGSPRVRPRRAPVQRKLEMW